MEWWLRRPNDIRGHWGLKFPDIRLTGEENPEKNLAQETCPDRGSNPGPLPDKRACYNLLHSGGHNSKYSGKNHLILPEVQIYSSLLGRKIHDLIFVLNFSLLSGKSGEAMLPLHSMRGTGWLGNCPHEAGWTPSQTIYFWNISRV